MTQIQPFRYYAAQFSSLIAVAHKFIQSKEGCIGIALAIILPAICWWKYYGEASLSLERRVSQLERDLGDFWKKTGDLVVFHPRVITPKALETKTQLQLKQLQDQVSTLTLDSVSKGYEKRIRLLYESALLHLKKSPSEKPVSSPVQDALLQKPWSEEVDAYEQCVEAYLVKKDEKFCDDLNQYKVTLLSQISEVYKYAPSADFLSYLLRIQGIGRRLIPSGKKITIDVFNPSSTNFGGLARNGNNSCYLATALQLFRAVSALGECFDPDKNKLQLPEKIEIQKFIFGMLTRMNKGETIPYEEGENLQGLLKKVNIIDRDVYGMYDAGEIATKLLFLMGFELESGSQSVRRVNVVKEQLSIVTEEYQCLVSAPPDTLVDVGNEIDKLTKKIAEVVQEKVGKIIHTREVTALPNFMAVEFLNGSPQLFNVVEFDDPLDKQHYKYELVLGMETTGAHWIAHVLCEENQWMTANDSTISKMKTDSLSKINRGYYLRKAKKQESGKIII